MPPAASTARTASSSISDTQSHSTPPPYSARCPIAKDGSTPIPSRPGSAVSIRVRWVAASSSCVVQVWPSCPTYWRGVEADRAPRRRLRRLGELRPAGAADERGHASSGSAPARDGRRLDDRGRGLAEQHEAIEHGLEVVDRVQVELHQEAVVTGDAVALDDLGRLAGELGDAGQLPRRRSHPDDRGDPVAERARVDLGVVAGDHARCARAVARARQRRAARARCAVPARRC